MVARKRKTAEEGTHEENGPLLESDSKGEWVDQEPHPEPLPAYVPQRQQQQQQQQQQQEGSSKPRHERTVSDPLATLWNKAKALVNTVVGEFSGQHSIECYNKYKASLREQEEQWLLSRPNCHVDGGTDARALGMAVSVATMETAAKAGVTTFEINCAAARAREHMNGAPPGGDRERAARDAHVLAHAQLVVENISLYTQAVWDYKTAVDRALDEQEDKERVRAARARRQASVRRRYCSAECRDIHEALLREERAKLSRQETAADGIQAATDKKHAIEDQMREATRKLNEAKMKRMNGS